MTIQSFYLPPDEGHNKKWARHYCLAHWAGSSLPVAAAEGCDRAQSVRTIGRLGVSGFTTALPPIAASFLVSGYSDPCPVAAAEGCDRAQSVRTIGCLGVSGFTTALPPIAAFVPRQRLQRPMPCSRCRRLRSSAKRSHNRAPRCIRFYDGFAADRSLRSSSAATATHVL